MRRIAVVAGLVLVTGVAVARAQNPQVTPVNPQPDSLRMMPPGPGMMGQDPERMRQLRMQVQERFGQMIQTRLDLSDQEMGRLRTAMRNNEDRRRNLMRREMDLQRAIGDQMQPGVAARADSLSRMLDAQTHIRVEMAQSDEQFQRELSFLTPVKRARLMMMMRDFEQRVRNIAERRGGPGGGMMRRGDGQPGEPQPGQDGAGRPRNEIRQRVPARPRPEE